jgi:hypothetical protein
MAVGGGGAAFIVCLPQKDGDAAGEVGDRLGK